MKRPPIIDVELREFLLRERDTHKRQRLATDIASQILRNDTRRRNRVPQPKPPESIPPAHPSKWCKLADLRSILK
jgi:hypothetical protein